MVENNITIFANLPYKVSGFIMYDSADDYYTIVLNSRLSYEENRKTFEHELQHIINNDFSKCHMSGFWKRQCINKEEK